MRVRLHLLVTLFCCALACFSDIARADPASVCHAGESALEAFIPCLRVEFAKQGGTQFPACDSSSPLYFVVGRRAVGFGERSAFGKRSKGITIETQAGALLRAPASGQILFAGEWRSYGPLVIIDAGCGRDVLLMGPVVFGVAGGERLACGDPIGHVSAPDSGVQPVIYYEVWQDGRPIDPGG